MPRTKPTKTAPPADSEILSRFAPLDEAVVAGCTDSGSFSRGRTYFRQGSIVQPVLTGDTISAECWGSQPHPYHVTAQLAPAGDPESNEPLECSCTCPRGGFCKHIVALLLTWIDDPAKFGERPPLSELLAERSHEELIALIERLVRHDPELMRLVELPVVTGKGPAAKANERTFDPRSIQRQVEGILRSEDLYEWGVSSQIAAELDTVLALGRSYASAGAWANAATVFAAMADAVLAGYDSGWDEEGDVAGIIVDCDRELAGCLEAQDSLPEGDRLTPEQRAEIIRAIYDIWRYDVVEAGGIDLSQEGPEILARCVTDDERARVEGWLRELAENPGKTDKWSQQWLRRAIVGFEVILREEAGLDDESLLEMYREAGLWPEVTSLLLEMGRVKEAIGIADRQLKMPNVVMQFADQLFALGDEKRDWAIDLIDGRLWETEGKEPHQDAVYLEWLGRRYVDLDRPEKALQTARRRFKMQPGQHTYLAVREAATLPRQPEGTWPPIRIELLKTLRDRKDWVQLIEIALEEHDAAAAVAALAKLEQGKSQPAYGWGGYGFVFPDVSVRVAEASEKALPADAIRIYRQAADRLIAVRGRPNYQQAAEYLARTKRLLEANSRGEEWPGLIDAVRTQNKTLRALRDELDARGL